jgi:hypothetical protein
MHTSAIRISLYLPTWPTGARTELANALGGTPTALLNAVLNALAD